MRLQTDRLTIRPWQERDLATFAAVNADPEVRRYYWPALLTRAESDDIIAQCAAHLAAHGFGFLALERRRDGALIGGAGLSWTHLPPCGRAVEIGWILARAHWRNGYAREAGRAWFAQGWTLGLGEIVGYTSAINAPSRATMASLGMARDPADDFDDETVPDGNPLRPHVLYRLKRPPAP